MSENKDISIKEIVAAVTALVLFGVLFSVTQLFQNPFIVFAVIMFMLYPFRKTKLIKTIIGLSVFIFVLWFYNSIAGILAPFIIAFVLSYILNPVVNYLTTKKLSRALASGLILLVFVIVFVTVLLLLAPPIVAQFSGLISSLPMAIGDLQNWVQTILIPKLSSMGIPTQDLQDKLSKDLPAKIQNVFNTLLSSLSGIFTGLSMILSQLVNIILLPFLTFYIMKDFDKIKSLVKELFPPSKRKKAVFYYHKIDGTLGGFIRGQLICSIIHGIIVWIFLSILGVKYAIFLGAFGVLLNIIPYFGLLIEITLAVIVSLFSGDPGLHVPLVIIIYLLQNLMETSFLIPKIIGDRIGLHPAMLILSLLVFSYFFGFVGMLIALPTMSVVMMFFNDWLGKREEAELKE